jgi:hypothetical protein
MRDARAVRLALAVRCARIASIGTGGSRRRAPERVRIASTAATACVITGGSRLAARHARVERERAFVSVPALAVVVERWRALAEADGDLLASRRRTGADAEAALTAGAAALPDHARRCRNRGALVVVDAASHTFAGPTAAVGVAWAVEIARQTGVVIGGVDSGVWRLRSRIAASVERAVGRAAPRVAVAATATRTHRQQGADDHPRSRHGSRRSMLRARPISRR